jgi:hypothetical protein
VIAAAANMTASFSNKVTINVQIGYGEINGSALPSGAAAESGSTGGTFSYATVATALKGDAGNSKIQSVADASLAASDPTNGGRFFVSRAQQKALGMISPTSTGLDGYVSLSSALKFDFTQSGKAGLYDAVGALEHEFTEVMGRTGSVGSAYGSGVYTGLDLFRFTSSGGTAGRALNPNAPAYFSIDGGKINLGNYNAAGGGDYADWSSSLLGDPYGYAVAGVAEKPTARDAIEMAALGWNLTSTAATLASAVNAYSVA